MVSEFGFYSVEVTANQSLYTIWVEHIETIPVPPPQSKACKRQLNCIWMFSFSHFRASVTFALKPFMPLCSNKNIPVQVDQSQGHVTIYTDVYVSTFARRVAVGTWKTCETEKMNSWIHYIFCTSGSLYTDILLPHANFCPLDVFLCLAQVCLSFREVWQNSSFFFFLFIILQHINLPLKSDVLEFGLICYFFNGVFNWMY